MQSRTIAVALFFFVICLPLPLKAEVQIPEQSYRDGLEALAAGDLKAAAVKIQAAGKQDRRVMVYQNVLKRVRDWEYLEKNGSIEARNRFWEKVYEDALRALEDGDFATAASLNKWVTAHYQPTVKSVNRLNEFSEAERTLGQSATATAEAGQLIDEGDYFGAQARLEQQLAFNRHDRAARSLMDEVEHRCAPVVRPIQEANNLWIERELDAAIAKYKDALEKARSDKTFASFIPQINDCVRRINAQKAQSRQQVEKARQYAAGKPLAAGFAVKTALDLWAENPDAVELWKACEKHYQEYRNRRNKASRLVEEQDYAGAISVMDELAQANPLDENLRSELERLRLTQKNRREQMAVAEALVKSNDLIAAFQVYQQINATREANDIAAKIARIYQDNKKYRQAVAFYEAAGKTQEAEQLRRVFNITEEVKPIMLSARSSR
jgi:hypothetical protein